MTDHVKVEIDAGVMTITLSRPEKKNALSNAMYGVLADSLEQAETDPAVRVVVFQADGDAFTAGNDLQDFTAQATGAFTGERHVGRFLKAWPTPPGPWSPPSMARPSAWARPCCCTATWCSPAPTRA
jgi:enoyl-CoA hydratase/carnithine racemase